MCVVVGGIEIASSPEDEGLVDSVLEPVVGVLGDAVFMALAAVDAGGPETVVVQQGGVVVVKGAAATAFHLVGGAEVLSLRSIRGTPPRVQRGILQTLCNARKVSPTATSA